MVGEPESFDGNPKRNYFLHMQVPPQQQQKKPKTQLCELQNYGLGLILGFTKSHVKVKALIGREWGPGLKIGISGWV